jgi:hypothetical protein
VQDHAHGREKSGEDADGECDRIDEAVDEGMKADADHGNDADGIFPLVRILLAHECREEAVEQVHAEKPDQQPRSVPADSWRRISE